MERCLNQHEVAGGPLRGKHLAVLGAAGEAECPLEAAARSLGARVSHLPADLLADAATGMEPPRDAEVLGRIYDAVVCARLMPAAAVRLSGQLGVPVIAWPNAGEVPPPAREGERLDPWQSLLLRAMR